MASTSNVLRTCGITLCIILQVQASVNNSSQLFISSVKVGSLVCDENICKYLVNVSGGEYLGHYAWRLTSKEGARGGSCDVIYPNYEIKEINTTQWSSQVEVQMPRADGKIYFCLQDRNGNTPFGGRWAHQGVEHFLELKIPNVSRENAEFMSTTEKSTQTDEAFETQQIQKTNNNWADLTHDIDVNYLPSVARPTREESKDIEVLIDGTFVPLNELEYRNVAYDNNNKSIQEDRYLNNSINDPVNNSIDKYVVDDKEVERDPIYSSNEVIYLPNANFEVPSNDIESDNNNNLSNVKKTSENVNVDLTQKNKEDGDENSVNKIDIDIQTKKTDEKPTEENEKTSETTDDIISNDEDLLINNQGNENIDLIIIKDSQNIMSETQDINNMITIDATENLITDAKKEPNKEVKMRRRRQVNDMPEVDFTSVRSMDRPLPPTPLPLPPTSTGGLVIEGIRVEDSSKEPKIVDEGIPSVLADSAVTLRVYGEGLTPWTVIAFTHDRQQWGQPCKFLLKGEYMVKEGSLSHRTALFEITVPSPITGDRLYICAKNLKPGNVDPTTDEEKYLHQGAETWKMLASHNKLLPLWVSLTLILTCLMFSALFSGLNLGLMSLDRTELKIISNTGSEQERKYARAIMPVRDHGNYLLCSILLGNVAVNSTFTILLDELTSGLFAVIFSTLAIVLLGEITPQAICSRHGLMVGAKSIMVTKAVMAVTAPLSFPVSKLLDYFLGEEIGSVYNRERLKELVKVTTDVNDLDKDEVNIISGALELRKKKVAEVMTKLEDAFMLPITSILDFETMSEIVKSGFSRIPVYEGTRGNIVTVLFIKDLAFVDPDDNTPLRTLCQYYQNTCNFVFEDVTLDIMFKQFKDGHKGHMAFVHRINNEGEGDPFYETIGLVTLEDVIEEMIQAEIVDETDVFMDNRSKRRRKQPQNKLQDFAAFAERHENQRIHISPQLTLATFQFLNTSVEAFRGDTVSETVLRRLLRQDVIHYIKVKEKSRKDIATYVFQQGKPVDYFVLILEGRVEVTVGRENLVFEAGPFTYFGVQALTQNIGQPESPTPSAMGSLQNINMDSMLRHTFVPDYSVRAITSLYYLTVKRSLYLAAKRATLMEKGNISKGGTNEQFDTEVDKRLYCTSSANIPLSMISKKLLGKSTSTASTKEEILSSASGFNKLNSRLNIIELTQVRNCAAEREITTPTCGKAGSDRTNQKTQSENFTQNETALSKSTNAFVKNWKQEWSNERRIPKDTDPTWAKDGASWAKDCTDWNKGSAILTKDGTWSKNWPKNSVEKTWSNERTQLTTDGFNKRTDKHSSTDIDANSCAVCVRNHFWMDKTILDKRFDDKSEQCNKKKATFPTDSTLITFHNISKTSQKEMDSSREHKATHPCAQEHVSNLESISREEFRQIDYKSNNRERCENREGTSFRHDSKSNIQERITSGNHFEDRQGASLQRQSREDFLDSKLNRELASQLCENRELRCSEDFNRDFDVDYSKCVDRIIKPASNLPECQKRSNDYKRLDYQTDYAYECDSSRQERSNNQELDSVDSFDRYLELERDTIDYEKDIKEHRLSIESRRLETEQIMMFQLSKIIKMLEKNS